MQPSAPGVNLLVGASRVLLEAVPGAVRQNQREGVTILLLVN